MVNIIDQAPSFGQQFAQSLGSGLKKGVAGGMDFAQKMELQDREFKQRMLLQALSGKGKNKGEEFDYSGLNPIIGQMENLLDEEGTGLFGRLNMGEKARFNRGRFQGLQASLMPLFKSIFPRGMTEKEFKFVNDTYIPQPNDSIANARGKIQALKDFIGSRSGAPLEQPEMGSGMPQEAPRERPPLKQFHSKWAQQ